MSTLDDNLIRRLKNLDRFLPRFQNKSQRPHLRRGPPALASSAGSSTNTAARLTRDWQPSLEEALAGLGQGELPENTALLGACEDGLPFLLDFTNPAPGAILIVGDEGSGKTQLLHALLASACRMNPPEGVTFSVLAVQPDEYLDLGSQPHCQEIDPVEDPAVSGLIASLIRTIEHRKQAGPQDPAMLLVIDDLAALLPFLDEGTFSGLYWLIRHGPRYQVWTLAALTSEQVSQVEPRFLTAFRTRLFGHIHNERLAGRLAGDETLATRDLQKGRQFFVPYNSGWLRFWVCEPQVAQPEGELELKLEGGEA